ncbi:Hypothetical_protein [Hexamita inflata]|uniref:Hypothetical_protein n=1 Tax=Hexamita inflata TaxID=28002 RepID=A0ABP1JFB4_9EUKA
MRQIQNDCFCECAFKVRYIDTIIPISSSLAKFNVDVDQNKTLDYSQSVYTKHFWNTKLFFDNHIFGKSIYTNISLYSMVSNCKLFSEYGSSPSLYFIFVIISDHLFKQVVVYKNSNSSQCRISNTFMNTQNSGASVFLQEAVLNLFIFIKIKVLQTNVILHRNWPQLII